MKAAPQWSAQLSVLDGWWVEGHIEGITGWSISESHQPGSAPIVTDNLMRRNRFTPSWKIYPADVLQGALALLSVMQHALPLTDRF